MSDRPTAGVTEASAQLSSAKRQALLDKILRERSKTVQEVIPRRTSDGPAPLSFAQQRLWLVDRLEPGSSAYNVPFAMRLQGVLDVAALRACLNALARRHETLRTTFAERQGGPVQVIHPPAPVPLAELDLRGLPGAEREAARLVEEESMRPFDLGAGPLLRTTLLRLGDEDHVLLFTLHHIVSDGWSRNVLVREVSALYRAFSRGEEPHLPELEVQYADYAVWQRDWLSGRVLQQHIGWWKERLAGAPPLLEVPTDRPRAARQSLLLGKHSFVLPAAVAQGLRELSRREGATLFMTLLAAWQVLLSKYSGQDDVVVGTPIAGRNRSETEGLIGFFVNMLALRADLRADPTWTELLATTRTTTLGAYDHQELPFERLVEELGVERSLTHAPVFQAAFSVTLSSANGERLELGELSLEPFGGGERAAKFDLNLGFADAGDALGGGLSYRVALFEADTAARMVGHLQTVLEAMVSTPERRLSELSLLGGAERVQVLEEWNRTERPYPRGVCIHELFEAQVRQRPDAAALVWDDVELTYAGLEARSNRLAHHLRGLGVGPEVRVGVLLERGVELIVSILAVLKAGGCYVPLDPSYPAERLALMLGDSRAAVLLSRGGLAAELAGSVPRVVCLEAAAAVIAQEPGDAPQSGASAQNLAYIVYTSGSTGRPKGVMVGHREVVQLVVETDYVQLRPGDRLAQASNASFDALTFEAWGALLNGATLVGIGKDVLLSSPALGRALREQGITTLYQTTALLNQHSGEQGDVFASLREVLFGGQAADAASVRRLLRSGKPQRLVHVYGPTETTAWCSYEQVEHVAEDAPTVTVGGPTGNARIYILDRALQPEGVGIPGEAYVGGGGIVRGYLERPELTAERFLPDPFSAEPGARMYRTGDRMRWRACCRARWRPSGRSRGAGCSRRPR